MFRIKYHKKKTGKFNYIHMKILCTKLLHPDLAHRLIQGRRPGKSLGKRPKSSLFNKVLWSSSRRRPDLERGGWGEWADSSQKMKCKAVPPPVAQMPSRLLASSLIRDLNWRTATQPWLTVAGTVDWVCCGDQFSSKS